MTKDICREIDIPKLSKHSYMKKKILIEQRRIVQYGKKKKREKTKIILESKAYDDGV
jgi:hypothetical protein